MSKTRDLSIDLMLINPNRNCLLVDEKNISFLMVIREIGIQPYKHVLLRN